MALTEEQIALKNQTIGGSDVAALFGESPYAQPADVWLRLTGRRPLTVADAAVDDPDDPRTMGSELEGFVRERYRLRLCEELGADVAVRQRHKPTRHAEHSYLAANIDADVVGMRRLGELKVVFFGNRAEWGDEGTDEVPAHYLLQCHFYLLVHDYEVADLFAWFGRTDFRRYEVRRDADMDNLLIETCAQFWTEHVEKDVPPEIDYQHGGALRTLNALYAGSEGRIVLPAEATHLHEVMKGLNERGRQIDAAKNEMKARLRELIGEHAVGILPGGGGYARKVVKRGAYTVEATEYETLSFSGNYKAPDPE